MWGILPLAFAENQLTASSEGRLLLAARRAGRGCELHEAYMRSGFVGENALCTAVVMGCMDAVQNLLTGRVDVDQPCIHTSGPSLKTRTPLMVAASSGDVEITKALLAAGADFARKEEGYTALDWAMGPCPPSVYSKDDCKELTTMKQQAAMLLHAASQRAAASHNPVTRKDTALFKASQTCDASVIDAMIRSGADVNKQHPVQWHSDADAWLTPLGAALFSVERGHCSLKAVKRLVKAGANAYALVLLPDTVPETLLLHFAKMLGQTHPVIEVLMDTDNLVDPATDPYLAQLQTDTIMAVGAMFPVEAREEAHTEAVEKQQELQNEVERLSQLVEQSWVWPVVLGVVLALFVGMMTHYIVQRRMGEAGARPAEGHRRQARARNRDRNHGQDRGRGQGRNHGQDRGRGQGRGRGQRAADPRASTPAPPLPTAVHAPIDEPDWWLDLEEFHDELDAAARRERPDFACPVTSEIMRVPYMLVDGNASLHTYEYNVLVSWFITAGNETDPVRNTRIDPARRNFISDGRLGREIRNWCEDKARVWRQELESQPSTRRAATRTDVHVFVDHSNVAIGARTAGTQLDLALLAQRIEAGREVRERVVVGSHESELSRAEWEQLGYTVAADPRRGKERFVDEALHAQLMRTAAKRFDPGRVIALVTGDGNANEGRTSFPQCVEEALKHDWHVELHSWRQSMSQVYTKLAEGYPNHFSIHYLDACC